MCWWSQCLAGGRGAEGGQCRPGQGRSPKGIHRVSSAQAFFNKNMSQLLAWAADFLNIPSYPEKGIKKKKRIKENGRGLELGRGGRGLRGKKNRKKTGRKARTESRHRETESSTLPSA